MKILVALDGKSYSKGIVKEVARLSENTLADVVFLGIQDSESKVSQSLQMVLHEYQQDLYSYFRPDELPYADFSLEKWQKVAKGDWILSARGMKEFTLRIRSGNVAKAVVSVAEEMDCDLVILGCDLKYGCEWDGEMNVPLRIAEDAPCSVLVIKQSGNTHEIVSILDQSEVHQEAMEMVNQLVTLHSAGLKIVGVQEKNEDKKDLIEQRMVELLKYYNDRSVSAWVKVIDSDMVTDYVTTSSQSAIIALWMGGRQSLLKRLFSHSMVDKLLSTSRSSVFILR